MNEPYEFEESSPQTWNDAFPWLPGTGGTSDKSWCREPISTDVKERENALETIAELVMVNLSHWTIGSVFPGLDPYTDLLALGLPVRAITALKRAECTRAENLMSRTVNELLDWPHVGVGTVDAILRSLASFSITDATPLVMSDDQIPLSNPAESSGTSLEMEWMEPILNDIENVASWFDMIGLSQHRVLNDHMPDCTPLDVVQARERLDEMTASNFVALTGRQRDIAQQFDDAFGKLDQRASHILAKRLFADNPQTLERLAVEFQVTRERVRQIEAKARGTLHAFIAENERISAVAETARSIIGTIRPLSDVLELMPGLGKRVQALDQPAWRILDRLDDAYEIEDGWCAVPTISEAESLTLATLQEKANKYGVVRLREFELIETRHPEQLAILRSAWLKRCGFVVDGHYVLTRTGSVGDYSAAILWIRGEPLSPQELVDSFVFERSARSLGNALSIDERFERVDRDRWALKEWGLEVYSGIRSIIREQLEQRNGRAKLSEIVNDITSRYSVSGRSVAAYASASPFSVVDGYVQFAASEKVSLRAPERTRRLFRRKNSWAYRVRISSDHLRGSGSPAPRAISTILDLKPGDSRKLPASLGPMTISWTGAQPQFGTIRRFLLEDDVPAGAEAFLVLHDDGTFSFELMRGLSGEPIRDSMSLSGMRDGVSPDELLGELSRALCLPDGSPLASIIGTLQERGDDDIAELLLNTKYQLDASQPRQESFTSPNIDEILDLL